MNQIIRVKKLSKYYKEISILYPNYSPLIQSKCLYSNIIKKQFIINKQENNKKKKKNYNIKKHYYDEKNENEYICNQKFFNSIIYNDILNENESFISILLG